MFLIAVAAKLVAAPVASQPHIVFILADDLGYGDVGAFNPKSKIATPHLDRLAAGGVRFTDAHAGGSTCVPSRYALLTGRFAARAALNLNQGPAIEEGRMTLPSMLRERGYATAMVGKWHQGFVTTSDRSKGNFDYTQPLRGGPLDRGFDSFFGMHASLDIPPYFFIRDRTPLLPPTGNVAASTSEGGAEGWNNIQGAFWRAGPIAPDFKHAEVTPRFAAEAIEVIRSYGAGRREKPLFCYLALPSPHTPWLPLEEFRGKSGAGLYGDFVMQVDAVVGRVLGALDTAGLTPDTLVFFTSDNGPVWYDKDREKFGHDSVGGWRGKKATSWEGGHRMPFIARWPGRIAPGSTSAQTIVFSDVLATLAELVGRGPLPQGAAEDSVSFLPHLLDPTRAPSSRAPIVHDQGTLRDDDWKLIVPRGRARKAGKAGQAGPGDGELFNLRTDPAEAHNLWNAQPERVRRMQAQLRAILGQ
jgi:arylsulfatase A-like enzyme